MKRAMIVVLALLAVEGTVLVHRAHATADDANAVWSREEAYWTFVKAADNDSYRSLWSDDFVGWPILREHPIHKSDISTRGLSNPTRGIVVGYQLQRESVEMHGPIGVTFYRAVVVRRAADGTQGETTERLSHTWMKLGDKWLIIAGMSAHEPAAADVTR